MIFLENIGDMAVSKCKEIFYYYKKELAVLEKYETYFRSTLKHNYIRNLTDTQCDELLKIYERANNGKKYPLCKRCGTSKLAFVKEVGKKYFQQTKQDIEILNN